MGEASYEVLKRPLESDLPEQIEVRVRRERRRRWTRQDKLRIVQEAFAPNAIAKHVAERPGEWARRGRRPFVAPRML